MVVNKSDLIDKPAEAITKSNLSSYNLELISADKNINIDKLEIRIITELGLKTSQDLVLLNNLRQKEAVETAHKRLLACQELLKENSENLEFIALEIRSALGALTELVGATENEDILGRIFSKFCIGK